MLLWLWFKKTETKKKIKNPPAHTYSKKVVEVRTTKQIFLGGLIQWANSFENPTLASCLGRIFLNFPQGFKTSCKMLLASGVVKKSLLRSDRGVRASGRMAQFKATYLACKDSCILHTNHFNIFRLGEWGFQTQLPNL